MKFTGGGREEGFLTGRWLDRLRGDVKEKGLSGEEIYDRATWRHNYRHTSTPHKSGNNIKRNNDKGKFDLVLVWRGQTLLGVDS